MKARATYRLVSPDGEMLARGVVNTSADFDNASSQYGDIALQTDARERLALITARRLREQIALDLTYKENTARREAARIAEAESDNDDPTLERLP